MEMDDVEKSRVEYVMKLEELIAHLRVQVAEAKAAATWQPTVNSEMDISGNNGRFTLGIDGKRVTVSVPTVSLYNADVTTVTTSIIESFWKNLISDRLRPVVQPHVERMRTNANAMKGSGQW